MCEVKLLLDKSYKPSLKNLSLIGGFQRLTDLNFEVQDKLRSVLGR